MIRVSINFGKNRDRKRKWVLIRVVSIRVLLEIGFEIGLGL